MKFFPRVVAMLGSALLLASCGGGGGGGGAFTPPSTAVTVTATPSTVAPLGVSNVEVLARTTSGSPVADGTVINILLSPSTLATAPVSATTVGGRVNFAVTAGTATGTVRVTASVGGAATGSASGSADITISGTAPVRLSAVAQSTVLPPNVFRVSPFVGSPYLTEIDVTWRRANGQLVSGNNLTIGVSVNPVTFGGFSTLDDPTTPTIDEFSTILGQGPVDVVAGQATLFFHSFTLPGNATVTITAVDPDTQENLSTTVVITIAPTAVALPSSVFASTSNAAVYVQGSGGRGNANIVAVVRDGGDNPVPNPVSGNDSWNNVAIEINNGASLGGARLTAINASGSNVSGVRILTRTFNGQATATFESGTVDGTVTITVTADRADNNVSNGIQDPVIGTTSLTVSDGKLFSIVLTSPTLNALTVNTVAGAGVPTTPTSPNAGPRNAGNNDGTYSLTVSALATDRRGNPVIARTALRFGLIDFPLTGFPGSGHGTFDLSGVDGMPMVGTSSFFAPTGRFRTAGGGAGPGDTLLVFGQLIPGNRDLQEARIVATVNTETSLDIVNKFNPNDDTGASVPSAALPYVIGRATEANIGGNSGGFAVQAFTDEIGVATVTLNYPVTRLGKAAYIYAQGDRAGGTTRKVTGAAGMVLPGAAPARVTASTSVIPGNGRVSFRVCLRDANNEALSGYKLGFSFHDLGSGRGTVDGVPASGLTAGSTSGGPQVGPAPPLTFDGCVTAEVVTIGITGADSMAGVIFSSGDATIVDVKISTGATAQNVVNVTPSSLGDGGGPVTISVTDSTGTPLSGLPVQVRCTATGDGALLSSTNPTITNANGISTATISAVNFSGFGFSGSGTCTYTVGGSTAVVNVSGVDRCTPAGGASPGSPPPGCVAQPVLTATPTLLVFPDGNPLSVTLKLAGGGTMGAGVTNVQISGSCQTGGGASISLPLAPTDMNGETVADITYIQPVPTVCPGGLPPRTSCSFAVSSGFAPAPTTTVVVEGLSCP